MWQGVFPLKDKKMYIFWKKHRGGSVDAVAMFFNMILSKEFFRKEDSFSMFWRMWFTVNIFRSIWNKIPFWGITEIFLLLTDNEEEFQF